MTLEEWIDKYEKKTGEKFKADARFGLFFLPDKGFCEIAQKENMVMARCVCGDIKFWRDKLEDFARKLGIKICGTWCIRKELRAYARLLGYKIVKEEQLPDGFIRITGIDRSGNKGWMSPAFTNMETGNKAYFVTWEVPKEVTA